MQYFSNFPTTLYTFDPNLKNVFNVTNIFTRVKFLDSILNNINVYYAYTMQNHDTFESIAYKYYGDANRYWIILFANLILDPQYQAPLNDISFQNYIVNKYGSLSNSQGTLEHYEKIKKVLSVPYGQMQQSTVTTSKTYYANTIYSITDEVSGEIITNLPTLAHPTLQLTSPPSVTVGNTAVSTTITFNAVSAYDSEVMVNNSRRNIQLPKKEYATQIEDELVNLLRK